MIQIEASHGSCPTIFEQPTKFPGPSGCGSCSRSGSLIVLSSQSVNRLIIEQLFHFTLGGAIIFGFWLISPLKTSGSLMTWFTFYCTYIQRKLELSMYSTNSPEVVFNGFGFLSSTNALYSSLKKRPKEMTRNSNCRSRKFQAN